MPRPRWRSCRLSMRASPFQRSRPCPAEFRSWRPPAERLLDLGCGGGRHACQAFRLGADVVAADLDQAELAKASAILTAMAEAGEAPPGAAFEVVAADALALPFGDGEFDCVVISEVL